ncbi:MAG: glycosyltransferase family 39 protein [Planctomycetota bacterium]
MRRVPWSILLLAVAVRWLVAARTEVPGRDGAVYLWMAQQVAHGEPTALFQTVFHPLYGALVGAVLWLLPALEPECAGQLVAGGLGALAVLPLYGAARRLFGARAAAVTALAYATGAWFARHPAECMSEGPFYLCAATWAWALARARVRPVAAGTVAGLGFLLRPEGASMLGFGVLVLLRRRRRRDALLLAAVALPLMALLPLGFQVFGAGATLTPKAAFNYEVGIGHSAEPWLHYLREAAFLPLAAAEQLGWLWLPLVLAGLWRRLRRRRPGADPATVLWLPMLLQCAVAPLLFSHWRFLSGYGLLMLPFAGAATVALWRWLGARHRALPWLLLAVLALAEGRVFGARNRGRGIERDLGRHLGAQLAPGEFVVSDMPRLDFYAGQQPPPPRPILPAWVLERAADPACRFVVLVAGRTDVEDSDLRRLGLEPRTPPPLLSAAAEHRGIRLFARVRTR